MNKQPTQKFKDYTKTYFNGPEKMDLEKRNELILTYTPLIKYIASRAFSGINANLFPYRDLQTNRRRDGTPTA